MTAVWTTPKTWNTGDPLTASDMNTHIRDNMEFLLTGGTSVQNRVDASDVSITSTSFVDVDTTNFKVTITPTSSTNLVVVFITGAVSFPSTGYAFFDLTDNGARLGQDDGLFVIGSTSTFLANRIPINIAIPLRNLSVASHEFRLQAKVSAGTLTFLMGAGTANGDIHPYMTAKEIN